MRATLRTTLAVTAVWVASAYSPPRECARTIRCQLRSDDGCRKAALVDVDCGDPGRAASHILVADAAAANFDPGAQLAVFDRRVERIEWSGADLLVAFARGAEPLMFSVFPGLRMREARGREGPADGLSWLRLSTRHCRR